MLKINNGFRGVDLIIDHYMTSFWLIYCYRDPCFNMNTDFPGIGIPIIKSIRPSCLYNRDFYSGKTACLYWEDVPIIIMGPSPKRRYLVLRTHCLLNNISISVRELETTIGIRLGSYTTPYRLTFLYETGSHWVYVMIDCQFKRNDLLATIYVCFGHFKVATRTLI